MCMHMHMCMYRWHPLLYRGTAEGGFVLAPPPLNRLICAYPGDGNSMGHAGLEPPGCQKTCVPPKLWDCSFPPDRLKESLTAQLDKEVIRS